MPRPASQQPTEGELEILKVLWETGPTELRVICSRLREQRAVATTTVATLLKIMQDKGLVKRTEAPRGSFWAAAKSKRATLGGLVQRFVDRVFDGSADRLLAHLIEQGNLSEAENAKLQAMLDEHGRRGGDVKEGPA